MNSVTVLGLGAMGFTIARLFQERGRRVTVWNRSAAKAAPLVAMGATVAPGVAAAVRASDLVVMCVYDYRAAREILQSPGVAQALAGKTLVQLTTGSPQEAREALAWTRLHGAAYLDGAIQAAPSQMGQADTPVLLSGEPAVYEAVREILKDLAGNIAFLGEKIEAAATMDLATLSYVYGATIGFVQGALIAETQGLDVGVFGALVADISPTFGSFFKHEGAVIQGGDFAISESPMRISIEATRRILLSSRAAGINSEIPAFIDGLFQRAERAGLADQELAALIQVVRSAPSPAGAVAGG